jgi:trans-aconitate methyltransferase
MPESDFEFSRQSFDAVSQEYKDARPEYDSRLFEYIDSVRHFTKESRILELGAGTGIATKQISDTWHSSITAVEPGTHLTAEAQTRLAGYTNINFVTSTFESFEAEEKSFDAVFSATAFHWLDPAVKYRKSSALLKDDGLLAVFWNYYGRDDTETDMQKLYEKYGMAAPGTDMRRLQQEKMKNRRKELETNGYFHLVNEALFNRNIPYTASRYINLLKTFSDHSRVPGINSFYEEVFNFIENSGGIINVRITAQLEIAAKNAAT